MRISLWCWILVAMVGISVLVVDDHQIFLEALQFQLSKHGDLHPVRTAATPAAAITAATTSPPDVAILDVSLDGASGIDLIGPLLEVAPGCLVLMLSEVRQPRLVATALRSGARGWLPKTTDVNDVIASVHGLMRGEARLDPLLLGAVLSELIERPDHPANDILSSLTSRERTVLRLLVSGWTRAEIATELDLSANTIRTHTQNVLRKLGVHSTLEAVATALRLGLQTFETRHVNPTRISH